MRYIHILAVFMTLVSGSAFAADQVVENYLQIQDALAKDTIEGTSKLAKEIAREARQLKQPKLATAATNFASAKDLTAARQNFKELSALVVTWAKAKKLPDTDVVYCPMADARWLQKKGQIRNPYYGKSMLECGEIQSTN